MAFENEVVRRIFGCKKEKVTRGWGTLRNEGFHSFSNQRGFSGHVARMEQVGIVYKVWVGNLKRKDHERFTGILEGSC
jgi:hypothetical protein